MSENRVGEVDHFFRKISVATVRVKEPIRLGDRLRIKGAHDNLAFRVRSMQVDHRPIVHAQPGQVVGIKVPAKAHEGSEVIRDDAPRGLLARLLGR